MPAVTLADLLVEILEEIFTHLLVLKPGSFFENPVLAASAVQKPLANYNAAAAREEARCFGLELPPKPADYVKNGCLSVIRNSILGSPGEIFRLHLRKVIPLS